MARLPKRYYPKFKRRAITGIPLEGKVSLSEEKTNFFRKNNVDIAVLTIAILTAFSYAIAYGYKLAQFMYYQIPIELIDINLKNVIWVLIVSIIIIFFIYFISIITTHPRFFKGIFNNKLFTFLLNFILGLFSMILLFLLRTQMEKGEILNKKVDISQHIYLNILIVLAFLMLLNTSNIVKTAAKKRFEKKAGKFINGFLVVSTFIIILFVPYSVGIYGSYYSSHYYLIKENTYSVVLTTYKDNFIVAPVNLKTKEITPKFSFLPIETDKSNKRQILRVKTGTLLVKEPIPINDLSNNK